MAKYGYQSNRWKDRVPGIGIDPTTRLLTIKNDTSSTIANDAVLTATIQRADNPSQEGTAFNATNMNNLETRIKDAFLPCMTYIILGEYPDGISENIPELPSDTSYCNLIEMFYADEGKNDGITSQRIHITNYSNNNYISLDSISCGIGDNNNFYLKTATYNIHKVGNSIYVRRIVDRTKRLVYENNVFHVENVGSVDIKIYKIIGYKIGDN